jgi:hypothetical protein
MFVYYIFQQQIPNWKSLFKNSILSGSSLGAHWELSGSSSQLRVFLLYRYYGAEVLVPGMVQANVGQKLVNSKILRVFVVVQ